MTIPVRVLLLKDSVYTITFKVEDRDSAQKDITVTGKAQNENVVTALGVTVADGIYTLSLTIDEDYAKNNDPDTDITVSAKDGHSQTDHTFSLTFSAAPGQQVYSAVGTHSFTCPVGVHSISVVAVGGGGSGSDSGHYQQGGGGGGLGYKNNIAVIPGNSYNVQVGIGGGRVGSVSNGGDSFMTNDQNEVIVAGNGGKSGNSDRTSAAPYGGYTVHPGGTFVGDGGGRGGGGGAYGGPNGYNSGGGAGGYSGIGGNGGSGTMGTQHTAGSGGGGGGGGLVGGNKYSCGGGGVGLLGEGNNGAAGVTSGGGQCGGGGGSSGGNGGKGGRSPSKGGTGGQYGGGGTGQYAGGNTKAWGYGGGGAVRIIWGEGRSFPSTNTQDA